MKVKHSHIELRDFITRMDHMIKSENFDGAYEVAVLLRTEIIQHAEEEEASEGWFQEAAKRAPRLNSRIIELRKQHDVLKTLVDDMCDAAKRESFSPSFSEFMKLFTRHDREEDGIIEEVFYQDDASQ